MLVVGSDQFYAPQKLVALWRSHIRVDPAHMSYKGIAPPSGTDVTKNLKSIYGHDDALVAVWLMVKEFPAPDDQIWFPLRWIHHIPPSSILGQDICSPIIAPSRTWPRKNNPRVKSIKMLILFENPLISPSIHIYSPLFSLLQIQWEPRPVLTRIQSKSIKILIFLFTPIFFKSMFLTRKILNVWFEKDA